MVIGMILQEHKISRRDMIQGIRECTGDSLLLMVLKDFTEQRKHGLNWSKEIVV